MSDPRRERSLSFGSEAAAYERGRPSYPPEAVDWLLAPTDTFKAREVLDLGAGTGKLTTRLVERGLSVTAVDPVAAIFVSMHTYNLLSEQADVNTIRPEHRQAHADFLAAQLAWQHTTAASLGLDAATLRRGFEFLQCCDNLSLIVCSGYDQPRDLRHTHPDRAGRLHAIRCTHINPGLYTLAPWPSSLPEIVLEIPYRSVAKAACTSLTTFQSAWQNAPIQIHKLILRPAS